MLLGMETVESTSRLARRVPFYYGWVIVGAVGLTMGLSTAVAGPVFSIFIEPWSDEFGWSRTLIAGAFSFGTVLAGMAGLVVGPTLDRYGGRVTLGVGALLIAISLISLTFATSVVFFYGAVAVGRVSMMNLEFLASPTIVANWFVRRRAIAMAVVANGPTLGFGLWPLLMSIVLAAYDWRVAFWVSGATVGTLAVVPLVLVVARRPEQIGLLPDGSWAVPALDGASRPLVEQSWTTRRAVRTRAFWLLMASQAAATSAGVGLAVHRVPFFVDRGLADGWVGAMLLVWAAGWMIGGFVAAGIAPYVPKRRLVWAFMMGSGITMLLILRVPANGAVLPLALVDGAFSAGTFAMLSVIQADYYGRSSIGTIRGLTHPVAMAALATGPLFGGVIFDAFHAYTWAFVTFGAVLIAGSIAAWFAIPPGPSADMRVASTGAGAGPSRGSYPTF